MPISTFFGLETALRGLLAQQRALDTTSHNIANANTVGYTRQQAVLAPTDAYTYPAVSRPPQAGQIGTGVDVVEYRRIRDEFIDVQLRAQTVRLGFAEARKDEIGQVEAALNEPSETGLSALLARYWSAWHDVANAPENMAGRQALAEVGASLADGFRSLSGQLDTIASQTSLGLGLSMDELNQIGQDLAMLNESIANTRVVGDQPNDLLDERDRLLDRLSELGAVATSDADGDGALVVTVNGVTLVDETTSYVLTETGGSLVNATLGESVSLTGKQGKIAGLVDFRDSTLPSYQSSLDAIASALISGTNALQAAGYDLTGTLGSANASAGRLFDGTDAGDITFNPAVVANPALIAASANGEPGNAGVALAQAALRTTALVGPSTIDTAYAQLVTRIGSDSQEAQRTVENARELVDALGNRRQSVSGVSLDEEMVNLVRYQRAYQASARALSVMDEMIEILVTRTGRVGV